MKTHFFILLILCAALLSSCAFLNPQPTQTQPAPSTTVPIPTTTAPPPTTTVPPVTTEAPAPKLGWIEEGGKRYYYPEADVPATGWLEIEGVPYYFRESGAMATGRVEIDGVNHFFGSNGTEILLVNPWNFLPEEYDPETVTIPNHWLKSNVLCFDALQEMLQACRDAGLSPYVASAYRTHGDQIYLYNNKIQRLMDEGYSREDATKLAGTVVAVPGTSEHELGLAFDLVDNSHRELNDTQEGTAVQKWLMENSWRYGFILRYPNNKSQYTGIIYEPWHYRYLGKELAKEIYESGLCLEEYLDNLTEQ